LSVFDYWEENWKYSKWVIAKSASFMGEVAFLGLNGGAGPNYSKQLCI